MERLRKYNPFDPTADASLSSYSVGLGAHNQSDWVSSFNKTKTKNTVVLIPAQLSKRSLLLWITILVAGLIILAVRVLYLQTIDNSDFRAIAEGNRIRIQEIKPRRGEIFDRYGTLLAKNIPSFSLALIPVDLPREESERQTVLTAAATLSGLAVDQIAAALKSQPDYSYQPVVIKEDIPYDEALLAKIESQHHRGLILFIDSARQYLQTTSTVSLSHVLGYIGKISESEREPYLQTGYSFDDKIGKAGIEITYEDILKGTKGRRQVEVDAIGQAKEVLAYQAPEAGNDIILTIDLELQSITEQSLKRVLALHGAKKGAAVVLDPNSGEVLSLVSLPSFNSNDFIHGLSQAQFEQLITDPDQPLYHRVVSGEYPSGSTFKMVVAAAALQEHVITEQTGFNSIGGIRVNQWFFPDWKAGGHGWTTLGKALAESVNTFFYIVGGGYQDFTGLGVDRITGYAAQFGLGEKLGIEQPNEAAGFLPSKEWKEQVKKEPWYVGDTYHLAIGQGDILVTPLQVAVYTSVIANGGTVYQPHLGREVVGMSDGSDRKIEPVVLNKNFIEPAHIAAIKRALRQTVTIGSARQLYNLPISVAAKTGTAQWSSTRLPHAWITAFAPYEKPEIVVTVLVEEGGEGSTVAQPVAADIIRWWAENR
ncbi:MAG: penicillin-binding protein 2 [Candidatus Buchananbacteria bacterium RIFCSPHIGHO2_01_FULL_47_11b]|uniref:Penicillin-binding protein 2 n=1 Tax=Candidatus Buchananbacteria bacterium RIFCSPHIGHO2_01_FULL_47_11b TaxID=1797537 RepID=A0A1G1Y7E6_9BACT|nr:MAG: penicillin-binding protein 2 [Candidatus Buchananbacteria bacterium RIFCSPHIGHO2_01_FULL_47_11b]